MRISFLNFAVGSLALCLLSGLAGAQETPAAADAQPAAVATTNETPAAVVTPPASPVITFESGQLTIIGNNGTLSDILHAIQQKTGATVESAAGMSMEQVMGQFGPGDPASVIAQLLNGTSLNYVLVGSSEGPQLAKVLLSIRPAHVEVQTADEGGSRRHRRGLAEAAAMEAQPEQSLPDNTQAAAVMTDPSLAGASGTRKRRHFTGNDPSSSDPSASSTDPSATDSTTADNTATDGSTPPADPNAATATNPDGSAAIGMAPGSPILPSDAPANIMKAIQHNPGPGGSPSGSGASPRIGASGLGASASATPLAPAVGNSYVLPNGATMLGPGIPLPNGAIFFPGGATMPGAH